MPLIKTDPEVQRKTPDEVVKRTFEFAGEELATGEVISSISSSGSEPSGITVSSPVISGTQVQVTLSGGTAGSVYKLFLKVVTSIGQTLEACGILSVDTR